MCLGETDKFLLRFLKSLKNPQNKNPLWSIFNFKEVFRAPLKRVQGTSQKCSGHLSEVFRAPLKRRKLEES